MSGNRNCPLCGYSVQSHGGTCNNTCRYDRRTGKVNQGARVHVPCAERHYSAHFDLKNPHSMASMTAEDCRQRLHAALYPKTQRAEVKP